MSEHQAIFSKMPPPAGDGLHGKRDRNGRRHIPVSPRVLVVSEDGNLGTSVATYLAANGLEAVPAADGREALKLARERDFDVLVTDVDVQPLDGVRTATAFRNINPVSQVFLVTREYEIARQMLIGANLAWDFRILLKPIDPPQLVKLLRGTWNEQASLTD